MVYFYKKQKGINPRWIVFIFLFSLLFFAPKTNASVPVHATDEFPVFASRGTNGDFPVYCSDVDDACLYVYFYNHEGRQLAAEYLREMTNTVIGWVQSNSGESVGFVGNLEKKLQEVANTRGGQFLNLLDSIYSNSSYPNLKASVFSSLQAPSLEQELKPDIQSCSGGGPQNKFGFTCTTMSSQQLDDFFNDGSAALNDGSFWPTLMQLALVPKNNPYGAERIAQSELTTLEKSASNAALNTFLAGNSFLGHPATPVDSTDCVGDPTTGGGTCITQNPVDFPGRTAADIFAKAIGTNFDFTSGVHHVCEAQASISFDLLNNLITYTGSPDAGGLFALPNDQGYEEDDCFGSVSTYVSHNPPQGGFDFGGDFLNLFGGMNGLLGDIQTGGLNNVLDILSNSGSNLNQLIGSLSGSNLLNQFVNALGTGDLDLLITSLGSTSLNQLVGSLGISSLDQLVGALTTGNTNLLFSQLSSQLLNQLAGSLGSTYLNQFIGALTTGNMNSLLTQLSSSSLNQLISTISSPTLNQLISSFTSTNANLFISQLSGTTLTQIISSMSVPNITNLCSRLTGTSLTTFTTALTSKGLGSLCTTI